MRVDARFIEFVNNDLVVFEVAADNLQLPLSQWLPLVVRFEVCTFWQVWEELGCLVVELRCIALLSVRTEAIKIIDCHKQA